ncbi:MAG: glycosyltransferase, partial [Oligoflexia bacterium]|nr:glycosyltransferase [Oligoflexia bacterium]
PAADESKGVAFLHAGALVPYKRPELVVEAFNRLGEPLWIVGSGPMERELKRRAKSNITFFGKVPDRELANFYRKSRALVFGGIEDFGLVPIECMAAGRPVVAPYRGGLRETVKGVAHWKKEPGAAGKSGVEREASSGVFISRARRSGFSAEVEALLQALQYFVAHESEFSVDACLKRAESFSPIKFYRAWDNLLYKYGLASRGESSAPLQEVG